MTQAANRWWLVLVLAVAAGTGVAFAGIGPVDAGVAGGEAIPRGLHAALLVGALVVLGFWFAEVEIQIEGGAGWAANLPTWRINSHPLLKWVWGGRMLTGYHLWIFTFMGLVFHLGFLLVGVFSLKLEARALGSIMVFWIIEDFLWFVLNPAFGVRRFRRDQVPWHVQWWGPVPRDYVVYLLVGGILIAWSFR